ncbi:MAG: hypothetical protein V5A16_04950 [Haloplanus sp.]
MLSSVGVGIVVDTGTGTAADTSAATAAQVTQPESANALAPRGRWNPATSRGEIILDSGSYHRVSRGENDIDRWRRASDDADVMGAVLTGRGGAAEGDVLDLSRSIPRDQTVGRYSNGDVSALVVEPRISSLRLLTPRGVELGSDVTVGRSRRLLLRADWNFVEAEDLQVDLRRNGVNYEREALSTDATSEQLATLPSGFAPDDLAREVQGAGTTGRSTAAWLFDFSSLDPGVYTLRVEGVDDLTTGTATRSITVHVGTESRPTLGFADRTVTRGDWAQFSISGSEAGTVHAVSVERSRLRSSSADPARVFRSVGNVVATGSTDRRAYGIVEVPDSGRGIGAIDTGRLDTGRTTVTLHGARAGRSDAVSSATDQPGGVSTVALDVQRGGIRTASIRVDRDTTFEASVSLSDLERGRVTALLVTPGRDGEFGGGSVSTPDGETIRLDSVGAFLRYVESQRNRGLTGQQVLARIDGQVLTVAGSDDLAVRETFRLGAPRTTVRDVVPASRPDATGVLAVPPVERCSCAERPIGISTTPVSPSRSWKARPQRRFPP